MSRSVLFAALTLMSWAPLAAQRGAGAFSFDQVRSYPFPNELTAAATGARLAWAFNEQGRRNIWVAEGPSFAARALTAYNADDGQELTSVQVSANGRWVVYVRGGDHGANWDDSRPVNPLSLPTPPEVQIWSAPFGGGEPQLLGAGDGPVLSPSSDAVAFVKGGQIWTVPVDGSAPAKALFTARGTNGSPEWSPDGTRLAFVSNRGDHTLIGVYNGPATSLTWIAPSFSRDRSPRFSPDGRQIAFVRLPGAGGAPDSALARRIVPWAIYRADIATGRATEVWRAPATLRGSYPSTHGQSNLHWAAGGRIVFLADLDGWPHLYSIPDRGGKPLLLTPGRYMAEYITLSPDRRWLVFAGNTGPDPLDADRRHLVRVPVDRAAPEVLTPGVGLEWTPIVTGDGASIAFIGATAQRPPLPMVIPLAGGPARTLAADQIPADFPTADLVTPRQVVFKAEDGTTVHGQLFEPVGAGGPRPAVVYVHGGPPRQMLLGWHYSDYYTNAYAMNQFLASRGFMVLTVNYRLGIGYGQAFHRPPGAGVTGAAEYLDVRAAGEWLAQRSDVDSSRIGIYGGSYGGFLTAMALGKDSKLFAAGVDIHGVHDRTLGRVDALMNPDGYERAPDAERAREVTWQSSPIAYVDTWRSPVLIIHGDDDRNVRVSQSTDLVQRLDAAGVPFETLLIVDDTHHFMRHANWLTVGRATADFFERKLGGRARAATP